MKKEPTAKKKDRTTKSVELPNEMYNLLEQKATDEDRSVSSVIRTIIKDKLVAEGLLKA